MTTASAPPATPQNAPAAPPAAPAPAVHQDWPVRIVVALISLLIAAGLVLGSVYLSYQSPRWSNAIMAGWTAAGAIVAIGSFVVMALRRSRR
ncbi:hypothetical protein ABT309_38320 [Streptomyces microflavus]|uniref:hypothetical protein n=1 Tax=Streptomyces TaxID=1883 RepID=UPI0029B52EF3|nr:hypothetical protein [Streptomyces sp. NRRL_B-2249]MDX2982208.1 hypothetical protein [Streptomyces sp. NRRL_B-2249]